MRWCELVDHHPERGIAWHRYRVRGAQIAVCQVIGARIVRVEATQIDLGVDAVRVMRNSDARGVTRRVGQLIRVIVEIDAELARARLRHGARAVGPPRVYAAVGRVSVSE